MSSNPYDLRVIWVTPRSPLGPPDGARHATRTLLDHLVALQIDIDLICIPSPAEPADIDDVCRQIDVSCVFNIPRSRSILLRLPSFSTPFTFRAFAAARVRNALQSRLTGLLKDKPASANTFVLFDGLHPFAALGETSIRNLSDKCGGVVYRAHNVETVFWEQCEKRARTPWFRAFFRHQASLVRGFERAVSKQVDLIAPVSEDDAAKFKTFAPKSAISVTPIGMDFPDKKQIVPVPDAPTLELLFIGRLDWIPNRAGLTWFLEKVWPRLIARRPNVHLNIAGVGDGRWLHKFRNLLGVTMRGKVEDIRPYYESSALSIAPLFQGSGTRVKIIEAARYGRAVMTTALGAEGLGLEPGISYLRAETQDEWLAVLETIGPKACQKAGTAAFEKLRPRFDGRAVAERLVQALGAVRHASPGRHA